MIPLHNHKEWVMKIDATCNTCGRTFLLSQIGPDSDAPGRCPFCGARFARHYGGALVDAVEDAENAANHASVALKRLIAFETGFDIDIDAVIDSLRATLQDAETKAVP
jgi:hypothetical protein